MKNSYSSLKCRLFYRCLINRKITFKKLLNVAQCLWGYFRQSKQASPYPFILSLELGNECNIRCKFCRDEKGVIHDYNPQKPATGIPQGKMSVEMACSIIEQVKDHILIAVLYTNGEPLLYHDLPKVIKYATERKVATMIATNGLLLNDRIMTEILEAGIDLIKIQLSGFTQDIYNIETRVGDVEKLKTNIRRMAKMNKAGKHNAVILIDYISYKYNRHQLDMVREFCDELDLMLSVRQGNPKGGLEKTEDPLYTGDLPLKCSCPWLWQGMQVNWNGDILPCCEAVVWGESQSYEKFRPGDTRLLNVWNSKPSQAMREVMARQGRGAIPMCSKCLRTDVHFKW